MFKQLQKHSVIIVFVGACASAPLMFLSAELAYACGPNPNECVVTAQRKNFVMGLQFTFSLDRFTLPDHSLRETSSTAPPDDGDGSGLSNCTVEGAGSGTGEIYTPSSTTSNTTMDPADIITNVQDATDSYGGGVSANFPGVGNLTLNQLMDTGAASVMVVSGSLSNGAGQTTTSAFGSGLHYMVLDYSEISAQSTVSTGSGTPLREAYVTFFHEMGHIFNNHSQSGNLSMENALDEFATEMLDSFEREALQNNDNPYDNSEC